MGSTINRTPRALLETILVAEKLLGIVPDETHDYQKFITPEELTRWLADSGMQAAGARGLGVASLISRRWHFTGNDLSVNYIMGARKPDNNTQVE